MKAAAQKNDSAAVSTLFIVLTVMSLVFAVTRYTGIVLLPFTLPVAGAVCVSTLYSLFRLEPGVETGAVVGSILGAFAGCLMHGLPGLVLFLPCVFLGHWAARLLLPFDSLKASNEVSIPNQES